jgi:exopolysaccharide production protein ExoZ
MNQRQTAAARPAGRGVIRFASLDFLRTLGFLVVFLFHFGEMFGPLVPAGGLARWLCDRFSSYGSVGTNTFFVLSSFFLYRSLTPGTPRMSVIGRRMERIYPGFVLVLALYLLLAPFSHGAAKFPPEPGAALLYILANFLLLPGVTPITPIVTVAWSLSYVVFSYGAICVIYSLFRMSRRAAQTRILIWIGVGAAIAIASWQDWTIHGRMIFFVGGVVAAEMAALVPTPGRLGWAVLAAGIVLVPLGRITPVAALPIKAIALSTLVWGLVSVPKVDSIVSALPVRTLSELSYPFFLVHGLVLQFLRAVWPVPFSTTADLIEVATMAVVLSLILSAVVNSAVLRPFRTTSPYRTPSLPAQEHPAISARGNVFGMRVAPEEVSSNRR